MPYNPKIHHRRSIRLKGYDYSQEGLYFVTICVQNKECVFGKIIDGKIRLSPVGIIADVLWYEIKNHANNVDLGEFTVMPNHIHGIILLGCNGDGGNIGGGNGDGGDGGGDGGGGNGDGGGGDGGGGVGARHALPLRTEHAEHAEHAERAEQQMQSRFQNQGKNTLSSVVGSYKSTVSKHAHRLGFAFSWQRNYYEHIIRNEQSYQNISNYIIHNPEKWQDDKFYFE
ncbi:MAG: transposase [Bacteroidales bacterium]|jgi:REP element-mobilizing transposase RayT|nr:transposase [Bacteroidales bacterium]